MVCRLPALRILLPSAMFLATTALPATMANAAAGEASRGQTTVTVERNAITVDNDLKYVAYAQDETIRVTLDYSATCNVVFAGLTMFRPVPFSPRTVTGSMGNVRGTPLPEHPGNRGSVSFDLRFTTLNETSPGAKSGLARLISSSGWTRTATSPPVTPTALTDRSRSGRRSGSPRKRNENRHGPPPMKSPKPMEADASGASDETPCAVAGGARPSLHLGRHPTVF